MTYTIRRYQSYQEYLEDETLSNERNYRLLSTGEAIEVADESDNNVWLASILIVAIQQVMGIPYLQFIRNGNKSIQVNPVGDKWVNRKPDVLILGPEHRQDGLRSVYLGQSPPPFVAEVVSPGGESSDNYLRDYVWKRQQYEEWQIPEYWIIDPHRSQITVLTLEKESYREAIYKESEEIVSTAFPTMRLTPTQLFTGDV